jgi:hypothetical protein
MTNMLLPKMKNIEKVLRSDHEGEKVVDSVET